MRPPIGSTTTTANASAAVLGTGNAGGQAGASLWVIIGVIVLIIVACILYYVVR